MGLLYRLMNVWFIKISYFYILFHYQDLMTKGKVNCKILPRNGHEGPERSTGIAVLFL